MVTSAGYRIGPGEIEDALNGHPAISMSAVVGVPDPVKTEVIRAFVVLLPGHVASEELTKAIQHAVRTRLARHKCPRDIAFVDALPMITTGKILRRELRLREIAKPGQNFSVAADISASISASSRPGLCNNARGIS